jgi:choline monooxygenase
MQVAKRYQQALIDGLDRPLTHAASLPNLFYTESTVLRHELDVLADRQWRLLAADGQIPHPGDVMPVTLSGMPLVLVRGRDGKVRCFHNVCKHRGVPLVNTAARGATSLKCQYHSWRYALDGSLDRASHFNGINDHRLCHVDASCLNLDEVRCETWHGLVCVNPGGHAAPMADAMASLDARWREYDFPQLRYGGTLSYRVAGNWKLVVENFLDSYHNPFVHPVLNKASLWDEHYPIVEASYFGVGTHVYDAALAGHGGLPTFRGLTSQRAHGAEYLCVSPTLMLGLHADYLFVLSVDPVDAQTTDENVYFFFVEHDEPSDDTIAIRNKVLANWDRINREDLPIIEGMQLCRRSPAYGSASFSPFHEGPLHGFQRSLATLMADHATLAQGVLDAQANQHSDFVEA